MLYQNVKVQTYKLEDDNKMLLGYFILKLKTKINLILMDLHIYQLQ